MRIHKSLLIAAVFGTSMACLAADGGWLKHVSEADRKRVNPFAGQADAIAAGGRMFEDHCSKCHGADAMGHGKRPSLRSDRCSRQPTAKFSGC